jgi:hypothetical protein
MITLGFSLGIAKSLTYRFDFSKIPRLKPGVKVYSIHFSFGLIPSELTLTTDYSFPPDSFPPNFPLTTDN